MTRAIGPWLLAAVAAAPAAWLWASCQSPEVPVPRENQQVELVLLGLDGASFEFIEPLLERGALPNLARLIEEGVSAPLQSDLPCLSIVLWTSVATGKTPDEHGIRDWSFEDPDTGEKGVNNSTRRRVEAIWNVASDYGKSVGFISWWASWPAEPVNGFMISDQFTRLEGSGELDRLGQATYPEELSAELSQALDAGNWPWLETQIRDGGIKLLSDRGASSQATGLEDRYRQAWFLYGQDYRSERVLFRLLGARSRPELLGYLSRKIDIASHYMWQFAETPEPDREAVSRLLEPVYRYEDALLGRILEAIGPEANVVIVSDHGFTWESAGYGHEQTAPPGIFIAHGPAFAKGLRHETLRIYDVMPVALQALGLPVARDLSGTLPPEIFSRRPDPVYVETFDGEGGRPTGNATSPLDERILQELKSLGYVP